MLKVDEKELIRRAYLLDGQSERQIAKAQKHSRHSVSAAIAGSQTATYHMSQPRAAPVMDAVKAIVDSWLVADQTAPRKQRHTAHRIFERLVTEQGFKGKEPTVRRFVRLRRAELDPPEAFLLLEYSAGMDAQCDFGEAQVILAGQPITVQLFCMRLCFSKAAFICAFPHQRQEAFLAGQRRAFEFYGAVPHRIWYDNLKTAVQRILVGHRREEQQAFVAFRSHYLFESRFCTPGEGHEKGLIENLVGYARRNFLVPVPEVQSLEALNTELLARCQHEEHRRLQGESQTIGERWNVERTAMLPLPKYAYECCRVAPARVNRFSLVTFETNRYSVPTEYAGRQVLVKASVDRLQVSLAERVIADHQRSYQREGDILDPQHFLRLLLERPGAWEHTKAIREWQTRWPSVYERYWAVLRRQSPEPQNVREFVRILMLERAFTEAGLATALEWALTARCYTCEGVLRHLREQSVAAGEMPASFMPTSSEPPPLKVAAPDLAQYQQLTLAGGQHGN
jgi:transposase